MPCYRAVSRHSVSQSNCSTRSAVAALLRRCSDCAFRESRVVEPESQFVSIRLRDSAARCSRSTWGCRPLLSRAISARMQRRLAPAPSRNDHEQCGEGSEPQKRRNQPEASFADCTTAQRFHCDLRIVNLAANCTSSIGNERTSSAPKSSARGLSKALRGQSLRL